MHDERDAIYILDEDVPESFRKDVRSFWVEQLDELRRAGAPGSGFEAVPSDASAETILNGEADIAIDCGPISG